MIQSTGGFTEATTQSADRGQDAIEAGKDWAAKKTRDVTSGFTEATTESADRVQDAIEAGTDWAAKKARDARVTSQDLLASVIDTVSARPLVAVGIAAAVGYLIARIASRD